MHASPDPGGNVVGAPVGEPLLTAPGRRTALDLLRLESHGRLIHTQQALPAVTLTPFVLESNAAVLVPVAEGSPLWSADDGVVAFEADRIEGPQEAPTGWIVVVLGYAVLITEPSQIDRLECADLLQPWRARGTAAVLRIPTEVVTGSWLGRAAPVTGPAGGGDH